jgi:hypothetical protein
MPAGKYVKRSDGAVMDAPLHMHWHKLTLWLTLEGILLALSLIILRHPGSMDWDPAQPDCRQQPWNCHFSGGPRGRRGSPAMGGGLGRQVCMLGSAHRRMSALQVHPVCLPTACPAQTRA